MTDSALQFSAPQFLDVHTLLEASEPRPRIPWTQFLLGGFVLAFIFSWYVGHSSQPGESQDVMGSLIFLGLMGFVGSVALASFIGVRRARAEHAAVGAVEELMQLRRWPEAGLLLQSLLSRPARSPLARAQALLFLAMVLARYHRFEDSVTVDEYILGTIPLDDATDHAIRLGRAMSLLREDNLLDADRAISELRRTSRGVESAGLALVELYRDVKTGHPAEAIEIFQDRLEVMRRQLGHRVADAWALVARAYDLLDRREESQTAFVNATILMPLSELMRRYPEVAPLTSKYQAAPAPAEVA
jgi:tetratricopeptide (TPR) repeat protein